MDAKGYNNTEKHTEGQPERGAGFAVSHPCWYHRLWALLLPPEDVKKGPSPSMRRATSNRILFEAVFFIIVFAALGCHVYRIQIQDGQYFSSMADGVSVRKNIVEEAPRGRILDKHGNLFACDVATRDVKMEPKRFAARLDKAVEIISRHMELEPKALRDKFSKAIGYCFEVHLANVAMFTREQAASIMLDGVEIKRMAGSPGNGGRYRVSFRPGVKSDTPLRQRIHQLAVAFELDEEELNQKCDRARGRFREITVARNVSRIQAEKMRAELNEAGIRAGVRLEDSWERRYPRNNELANMLGFVNSSRTGVFGIESLMDSYLQPTRGEVSFQHDRWGRPTGDGRVYKVKPEAGADVYLTIQEPLQQIVEEELAVMWEKNNPERAYAIMMDPATGEIMALAQYPQINPNERDTLTDVSSCQSPCIVQSYDPGSIMKAISLAGVLQSRTAGLDSVVDCEGGRWYYGGRPLRDSHGYGDLTLAEVIQKSSNIGTAKLALQMGEEEMFTYLDGFGFGRRTGLGFYPESGEPVVFKGEASGIFRPYRKWMPITITRVPIGQGISMTPMQMIQAWSALANGGTIMQPYIVERVKFADGRVVYSEVREKARPVSGGAVRQMVEALKMVTKKGGTGTRAAVPGYEVAGKTGTAQFWVPTNSKTGVKGHYTQNEYFASFIGFAPADNPRFLLLVSAENPRKGYHTGSGVSAPVFGRIAARTLEYLQVPPDGGDTRKNGTLPATAGRSRRVPSQTGG